MTHILYKNTTVRRLSIAAGSLAAFLTAPLHAAPPGSGWNVAFEDNFNGNSVDTSKWRVANFSVTEGASVPTVYRPSNLSVSNGLLKIKGSSTNNERAGGRIDTWTKRQFRYGYYEVRSRVTTYNNEIWPAFWLAVDSNSTELDIIEHYPPFAEQGVGPNQSHHERGPGHTIKNTFIDPSQWHTYSCLWTPSQIVFFVDGQFHYWSNNPTDAFDQLYMILSSSPSVVREDIHFPGKQYPDWEIDYVRVWEHSNYGSINYSTGAPINQTITLQGSNGKYVSSENGTSPMICNRDQALGWEKFFVQQDQYGQIALKGTGGYASSEAGKAPMRSNRNSIGGWERFSWIQLPNNQVSLRGIGGLVSSENGTQSMNANRPAIGAWEKFTWAASQ